jgi:hypothetical protein
MDEFEFFVRIAGKDVRVRMGISVFGAVALNPETLMSVMSGWEAVKSAYKVSQENGCKAEKLMVRFNDACWEMRDCR